MIDLLQTHKSCKESHRALKILLEDSYALEGVFLLMVGLLGENSHGG